MSFTRLSTAVEQYVQALRQKVMAASGPAYQGLFVDNNVGTFSFTQEPLVNRLTLIDTDEDLGFAKTTLQSNEYIFNTWLKISRGNFRTVAPEDATADDPNRAAVGYSDNAIPSERDGFVYDPDTDRITNAIDSYSMVGFISPEDFEDYVFDVRITSASTWQSDPVGIVIGYVRDADGSTHTLSVFRSLYPNAYGYMQYALTVHVDLVTVGNIVIAGTNQGLDWMTGEPATGDTYTVPEDKVAYNVVPFAELTEGVRIRVERRGDVYTITGGRVNSSELVTESQFSFDLNDHPATRRFKGPTPYGFASLSQDRVDWESLQRPGNAPSVIDIRSGEQHVWDGAQWQVSALDIKTLLKPARLYYSDFTGKVFYCDTSSTLRQLLKSV